MKYIFTLTGFIACLLSMSFSNSKQSFKTSDIYGLIAKSNSYLISDSSKFNDSLKQALKPLLINRTSLDKVKKNKLSNKLIAN